ncbi:MAG: cobalamin biosynthesis bifunctional protein CbiET [Bacteroidetes bacterium]|nr:MAG: cobalamin biosynthesis bifunctional protein CbiET [Bacteroidota bacterium]
MQAMVTLHIIGISDSVPGFSPEIGKLIRETTQFAGGRRHLDLLAPLLPEDALLQPIEAPIQGLVRKITELKGKWVILASGDPLFFGIGNTLIRAFPEAEIRIYPAHHSLQLLAHRFKLPYGNFDTISLTGRSMDAFHEALVRGVPRMGILTDRKHTPAYLAEHMLEYGFRNYRMFYGERLGGEKEKTMELSLEEARALKPAHPNCFFMEKTDEHNPKRGIPEEAFSHLKGRPNMITKLPVRLCTLSLMQLENRKVFWDIGTCTGSVSIEARLQYPHLQITAFERREEARELLLQNARRFQAPGIRFLPGDFLETPKEDLEKPDAVFLGGYGGKMEAILKESDRHLIPGGILAFNSVSDKSQKAFLSCSEKLGYRLEKRLELKVDQHNLITVLLASKRQL